MSWLVLVLAVALAFANGANDNFKGVATIYGSGTAPYRLALAWATATTFAGSLLSLWLAAGLIKTFSGTGLVPAQVAHAPHFVAAVALGSTLTVLLATRLGFPVSTTHALAGALVGAGALAGSVHLGALEHSFLLPLGLSPLIAVALTSALYPLAALVRRRTGVTRELCVCVGREWVPVALAPAGVLALTEPSTSVTISTSVARCRERYEGEVVGVSAQQGLDLAHFLSAGAVSFARGVNDTPKLAALLLAAGTVGKGVGVPLLAAAIAVGGVLFARRVADTMSHRITTLSPGQGLIANATSAALVITASRYGLPVSTTHVTNGGLFGIGAVTRSARWKTITSIIAAWLITLPLGALLAAAAYTILG